MRATESGIVTLTSPRGTDTSVCPSFDKSNPDTVLYVGWSLETTNSLSLIQSPNAYSTMLVTLSGIVTLASPLQL